MRKLIRLAVMLATPVVAFATDVGVSISVGQPGFYGQINLGPNLVPQLLYPQPVIIMAPPPTAVLTPVYLHVPPGHAKRWKKHCHKYNACGRRVYFVKDDWYNNTYVPYYRDHRDEYRDNRRRHDHDDDHGHGHKNRGNHDHDDDDDDDD